MESIKCSECKNEINIEREEKIYFILEDDTMFNIENKMTFNIEDDYFCKRCANNKMGEWKISEFD